MSEEKYGTAMKPLKLKCTSIGSPDPAKPYWCLVLADGRQMHVAFTFDQARLIMVQSAGVVAAWPAEPA
jgi:hypothetical protein